MLFFVICRSLNTEAIDVFGYILSNTNKSFIRYHRSSNSGGELEIVTVIKKGDRVARKYTSQKSEEVGERGKSI